MVEKFCITVNAALRAILVNAQKRRLGKVWNFSKITLGGPDQNVDTNGHAKGLSKPDEISYGTEEQVPKSGVKTNKVAKNLPALCTWPWTL
jgi:hypothetical protein